MYVLFKTACHSMLGHLRSITLEDFKVRFEKALESREGFASIAKDYSDLLMFAFDESYKGTEQVIVDTSKAQEMIWCNLNAILARAKKLFELTSLYEGKLNKELFEHVKYLLDDATDEKWSAIRRFLHLERMTTLVGFASTLSSFNIYQTIVKKLVAKLKKYVKSIVESKTKEEAGRVLMNMKDRFKTKFSCDSDSMPRLWTRKEDIKAITKTACSVMGRRITLRRPFSLLGGRPYLFNIK